MSNQSKQKYAFKQVCQRVEKLNNILLQSKDSYDNLTLLELLLELTEDYTDEYIGKIKPLLDGSKLEKDFNRFYEEFPNTNLLPEDNLALQMYENVLKLLERNYKK